MVTAVCLNCFSDVRIAMFDVIVTDADVVLIICVCDVDVDCDACGDDNVTVDQCDDDSDAVNAVDLWGSICDCIDYCW